MLSRTHVSIGILTALSFLIFKTDQPINLREFIPGAVLGSIIPDIDTARSWAAQTIPFIDDLLRKLGVLSHRGLAHGNEKIIGIFIISSLLYWIYFKYYTNDLMLGLSIGYISHIIADYIAKHIKLTCKKHDGCIFKLAWMINILLLIKINKGGV